ncbi:hypothetical protein [Lactococcus allomyrinae]|uniref:Uncharacterized protein n=1 Tax=Lactococcus allomyrinae TaxID=2419773 RepID=A0A387BFC6_9LACT|nr:hypothetical protein [Lactococcus allomyrinae]AYG01298.1 hypothetical protein D7I46_09430 [Lactococcus allomyrinae]
MIKEEQIVDLRRDIEKVRRANDSPRSWEGLAEIEKTINYVNRKYGTSFKGYDMALSEAEAYLWNKHDKLKGYY